jgi:hypothetical protein
MLGEPSSPTAISTPYYRFGRMQILKSKYFEDTNRLGRNNFLMQLGNIKLTAYKSQ